MALMPRSSPDACAARLARSSFDPLELLSLIGGMSRPLIGPALATPRGSLDGPLVDDPIP